MSLTLAQNLKGVMSEALLSRFDVIFLMRSEEDGQQEAMSRHILQQRMHGAQAASQVERADWCNTVDAESGRETLKSRLSQAFWLRKGFKRHGNGSVCKVTSDQALPQELLQTYLRYARRYAQPTLSAQAKQRIKARSHETYTKTT